VPANKLAELPVIRYALSTHGTFAKSACGLLKNDSRLVEVRPHSRLMQNRHVMNLRRRLAIYEFTSSNGELDPRSPNGPFCRELLPYPGLSGKDALRI
jgi:hypothetical protein